MGLNVPINGITDTNQSKDNLPLKQTVHVKADKLFSNQHCIFHAAVITLNCMKTTCCYYSISTDSDFMSLAGLYLAPKWTLHNH